MRGVWSGACADGWPATPTEAWKEGGKARPLALNDLQCPGRVLVFHVTHWSITAGQLQVQSVRWELGHW